MYLGSSCPGGDPGFLHQVPVKLVLLELISRYTGASFSRIPIYLDGGSLLPSPDFPLQESLGTQRTLRNWGGGGRPSQGLQASSREKPELSVCLFIV